MSGITRINSTEKLELQRSKLEKKLKSLTDPSQEVLDFKEIDSVNNQLRSIKNKIRGSRQKSKLGKVKNFSIRIDRMMQHSPQTSENNGTENPSDDLNKKIKELEEQNASLQEQIRNQGITAGTSTSRNKPNLKINTTLAPPNTPTPLNRNALNQTDYTPLFLPNLREVTTRGACRESFLHRLKLIPTFTGKSKKELTEFLDICDALNTFCINDEEYSEFMIQISIQLRSEARIIAGDKPDWLTIRDCLVTHFHYLSNREIINSKIDSLRQQKKETLLDYAERARNLSLEKNSAYDTISLEQKQEHDRTIRRSFAKGIFDAKLRDRILLRGSDSLEEAIALALEMENDINYDIHRTELFCSYCKSSGHRMKDCRKKERNNSDMGQLINAFKGFGINPRRNNFQQGRNWNNQNNGYFQRNFSNGFNRYNNNNNYGRSNYNNPPFNQNQPNSNRNYNNNGNQFNSGYRFNSGNQQYQGNNFNNNGYNGNNGNNTNNFRQNTNRNNQYNNNNRPNRNNNNESEN